MVLKSLRAFPFEILRGRGRSWRRNNGENQIFVLACKFKKISFHQDTKIQGVTVQSTWVSLQAWSNIDNCWIKKTKGKRSTHREATWLLESYNTCMFNYSSLWNIRLLFINKFNISIFLYNFVSLWNTFWSSYLGITCGLKFRRQLKFTYDWYFIYVMNWPNMKICPSFSFSANIFFYRST